MIHKNLECSTDDPLLITKVLFQTNHFNANQKVFMCMMTGGESSLVRGRFRGKGRYIKAWVKKTNLKWPMIEGEYDHFI